MTEQERIADKLSEAFKTRVAAKSGMTFEETGVTLPAREIWLYYAAAVLDLDSYVYHGSSGRGLAHLT